MEVPRIQRASPHVHSTAERILSDGEYLHWPIPQREIDYPRSVRDLHDMVSIIRLTILT